MIKTFLLVLAMVFSTVYANEYNLMGFVGTSNPPKWYLSQNDQSAIRSFENHKLIFNKKTIERLVIVGNNLYLNFTNKKKLLLETNENGYNSISLSPDEKYLIYIKALILNEDTSVGPLVIYNTLTNKKIIAKKYAFLNSVLWLPDNERFIFTDYGDLFLFNIKNKKLKNIFSMGGTSDKGDIMSGFPKEIEKVKYNPATKELVFRFYPSMFSRTEFTYYVGKIN